MVREIGMARMSVPGGTSRGIDKEGFRTAPCPHVSILKTGRDV